MLYWILSTAEHSTDINSTLQGSIREATVWDERIGIGDFVYLTFSFRGVYGWGNVMDKQRMQDESGKVGFNIKFPRTVLNPNLILHSQIEQSTILSPVFRAPKSNLVLLTMDQISQLNNLMLGSANVPPDPQLLDGESIYAIRHAGRHKQVPRFQLGQPVVFEEARFVEFKEITGANPVGSILKQADQYAVACLNGEGGRIFWGIRNNDRVVTGLSLTYSQRDQIKREVCHSISQIQPGVLLQDLSVEFHDCIDSNGTSVADNFVFELDVPRGNPSTLYATKNDEVYIKTDAGKQKLRWEQIIKEILQRNGISK